jgi:DNA-binding MarR family transcriptional regulator
MKNPRYANAGHDSDPAVAYAKRKETVRDALKLFRVLLHAEMRNMEQIESELGISGAELPVLIELSKTPGMRVVDLAKSLAIHRQAAEGLINDLVEKKLVLAAPASATQTYFLSADGKELVNRSPEHGHGVLKSALDNLPDRDLEQLVNAFRPMVECMPVREEKAARLPLTQPSRSSAH